MLRLETEYWVSGQRIFLQSISRLVDSVDWVIHLWRTLVYRTIPRGGQPTVGQRGMRKCTTNLVMAGVLHSRGWGPQDRPTDWLCTLKHVAANHEQLRSCCQFLLSQIDWKCAFLQLDGISWVGYCDIIFSSHWCRPISYPPCIFIRSFPKGTSLKKIVINRAFFAVWRWTTIMKIYGVTAYWYQW